MRAPRFRIRTLVVVVFTLSLILAIGALTRENSGLRTELQAVDDEKVRISALEEMRVAAALRELMVVPQRQPDPVPTGAGAFAH
jgi:hypothetical protein